MQNPFQLAPHIVTLFCVDSIHFSNKRESLSLFYQNNTKMHISKFYQFEDVHWQMLPIIKKAMDILRWQGAHTAPLETDKLACKPLGGRYIVPPVQDRKSGAPAHSPVPNYRDRTAHFALHTDYTPAMDF